MIKTILGLKLASSIFATGLVVGMSLIICNKSKKFCKNNSNENVQDA